MLLVLTMLCGCSLFKKANKEEETTTKEAVTQEVTTKEKETTSTREASGRLDATYDVAGYTFPVSSKWLKEAGEEGDEDTMYFYNEDNSAFVMFQTNAGNYEVLNEDFQSEFTEGFSSGLEDAELIKSRGVTLENGVEAFNLKMDGDMFGLSIIAEIYCFNGLDGNLITVGFIDMSGNTESDMVKDFDEMINTFYPTDSKDATEPAGDEVTTKDNTAPSKDAKLEAGTILLDNDYVLITFKEFSSDMLGQQIKVEITNKSDRDLLVQANDAVVNGYMTNGLMSKTIKAGKKSVESITFYDSDLEDIDVTELKDATELICNFRIMDDESWDELEDIDVTLIAE